MDGRLAKRDEEVAAYLRERFGAGGTVTDRGPPTA
jgi:translation initiation factor 1 (eIF-1/SUI1)